MRRLFVWLIAAFAGLLLFASLIRSFALTVSLEQSQAGEVARSAQDDARAIATWAAQRWTRPPEELRSGLATLAHVAGARVWLVDAGGTVAVDTGTDPRWEGVHIAADELERARRGAEVTVSGRSPWLESATAFLVPVRLNDNVVGVVFLFVRIGDTAPPHLTAALVSTGALSLSLAAALAFLVSRRLSQPVERITRFARELGQGRFGRNLHVHSYSEVNELADTLSQVSQQLAGLFSAVTGQRQLLAGILHSMQDGVIATNETGRLTLVNEAARQHLRLPPSPGGSGLAPDVGGADPGLLATHVPQRLTQALAAARQGRTIEVQLRPGGTGDLLAVCFPAATGGGQAGAVAVIRDVAAIMRLQRTREHLIADVAHELRGPLANLSVLAEGLADGTIRWRDRRPYLNALETEIERLRRLANDVLDLARMDAGVLAVNSTTVVLARVGESVVQHLTQRFAAAGVALRVEIPVQLQVCGDPARLEQVVGNLLENALRHTPAGGCVTVSAAPDGQRRRLDVADTGAGIAADHLPHLFERFYKADPARSPAAGTGLGLALVRQLVELQGGSVGVASVEGQGAVFSVWLQPAN